MPYRTPGAPGHIRPKPPIQIINPGYPLRPPPPSKANTIVLATMLITLLLIFLSIPLVYINPFLCACCLLLMLLLFVGLVAVMSAPNTAQ